MLRFCLHETKPPKRIRSVSNDFTDFTVTCWVFGVLDEGKIGRQRASERSKTGP